GDERPDPVVNVPGPKPATLANPTSVDPAERAKKDIQRFRDLVDPQLVDANKPDRYTEPYATIQKMIDKSKASSDFAAQKAWSDELGAYTQKVNSLITPRIWAPIKAKADAPFNSGNYGRALEELAKLEDVYKYFRNDDKVE